MARNGQFYFSLIFCVSQDGAQRAALLAVLLVDVLRQVQRFSLYRRGSSGTLKA
jgi:hypothetical protein